MKRVLRAAIAAAATIGTLVFASAALAANTGKITVSYSPMKAGSTASTTIKVEAPQSDDAIAAVNIFTGTNFVNGGGAPNTQIGQVEATAFAHDANLNLPLSGPVTTDDPAKHAADPCSPGTNFAVWNMNLSAAGQTLVIPIYVNKATGPAAGLGAYNLKICLPPWDLPAGTPGRAFQGAQLLDATLTLDKIFTAPTSTGLSTWEALFTPYTPGKGTPNAAGTFEARAFVPLPISLGIHPAYKKKTNSWGLTGTITAGGQPAPAGTLVRISRGLSPSKLTSRSTTKVGSAGTWKTAGHLSPRKTTYFRVAASRPTTDYTSIGCANPQTALAPAGCVSATLTGWSGTSAVVRIRP
jgi:hypothetical protein